MNNTTINLSIPYNTDLAGRLKGQIVLIKCGGNAMTNDAIKKRIIHDIVDLKKLGILPIVVHGGGPVIKHMLKSAGIASTFVEGHRVTDSEAIDYVEMALSGKVNGELVSLINRPDAKAVGLSGKDGQMVTAVKRFHQAERDGETQNVDLGFVGNVKTVNIKLVQTLIEDGYIPVISPVSMDEHGDTYNINADMFAGHLAGALSAAHYVVLTDVKGVMEDPEDDTTLVKTMSIEAAEANIGRIIQGGMIPKVESCIIALKNEAGSAHIVSGLHEHTLLKELLTKNRCGTLITA